MHSFLFSSAFCLFTIFGLSAYTTCCCVVGDVAPGNLQEQQDDNARQKNSLKSKGLDGLKQKIEALELKRKEIVKVSEQEDPQILAIDKELKSLRKKLHDQESGNSVEKEKGQQKTKEHIDLKSEFHVTKAKDFLEQIRDPKKFMLPKLNKKESEKVIQALREEFPFESIEERMKNAQSTEQRLEKRRALRNRKTSLPSHVDYQYQRRVQALKALHENATEAFVNADQFGFSRMPQISPKQLFAHQTSNKLIVFERDSDKKYGAEKEIELAAQVKYGRVEQRAAGVPYRPVINDAAKRFPSQQELAMSHLYARQEFTANAGYVKSLKKVSGFQPHSIGSDMVKSYWRPELKSSGPGKPGWKLNRLELVGMLLHDQPRVYVSDQLPDMEKLDAYKTRDMNAFEKKAIKKILEGESTVVKATNSRIQMVGALWATKNCLQCHRAKSGDVLGAFSYEILRTDGN